MLEVRAAKLNDERPFWIVGDFGAMVLDSPAPVVAQKVEADAVFLLIKL